MATGVVPGNAVPCGYEQITSLSSAASLTPPTHARFAVIKAEAQAVRWREGDSDPTATVGMPMATTDQPLTFSGNLKALRFIEQTASAKLNVQYYG